MSKLQKFLTLGIAVAISVVITLGLSNPDERNFNLSKNLSIYHSILRELNLTFVDDFDPKELIDESIESMLNSLDPYTTYIPEEKLDDYKTMTTGEYAGIGALIGKKDDHVIIVEPYEDFPAHKFGLKAGDMIIEIDGENMVNKETGDVSKKLRGKAGSKVNLKIKRPYQDEQNTHKSLQITREVIQLKCVPYFGMLDNNIGYIILTNFTDKAENSVKHAVMELKDLGATSLILDVQGNPGGLLSQAVNVTNLFVDKGTTIVSTKGKHSRWQNKYTASNYPLDKDIPLVILVDENSASASEIVAGAIQDIDRGIVIGNRTFGKGLVQQTRPLAFNAQLKLTTAYYYLPSGRSIQKIDYRKRKTSTTKNSTDTLKTEFQTKNGRKVYDGGGIYPDFIIESPTFSRLSSYLSRNYILFDFATKYATTHPVILPAAEFKITDDEFKEFKAFVLDKDINFRTESSDALKKLKKMADKEKFLENIQEELSAIERKITSNIYDKMDEFKEELIALISYEITKRYYHQEGAIENILANDKVLEEAVRVLSDKKLYTSTLTNELEHVN